MQGKQLGTFTSDYYVFSYEIYQSDDYLTTHMPSGVVTLPDDSRPWEFPEKVDNVGGYLFKYFCVECVTFHQVRGKASQ